jgi:hypothetical protein
MLIWRLHYFCKMRVLITFALSIYLFSCKGKPSETTSSEVNDTTQFFQVSEFIEEQVKDVNKTPYYIYKKTIENEKTDSTTITNQQFAVLAKQFLEPDINNPSLKKEYIESPFFDQTTNTYTLNYTTKNKELEIQNIDVLLLEDAETLKRIFIRKFFNYGGDSSAIEQLSWTPNHRFQVSRMVQKPDQPETSRQTIVVWNDKN